MQVKHKIKIDMLNPGILPKIDAVQNDANSRAVELRLYAGSEVWNVPENADVSIAFSKADNTSGLYDTLPDGSPAVEVADNVVTIILAPQVLTSPGIVSVDVKVSVGLKVVSTFPFLIRVFKDPACNAVKSENYYKVQNWEEVNNAFDSLMPIYVVLSEHDTVSNFSSSEIFGYVRSRTPVFLSHNSSYIPLSSASEEYADFELYAPTTKTKTVYRIDDACTVSVYEQTIGEGGSGSTDGAVLYTAQNLTPEQKAQARANIGAAAVGEGGGGSVGLDTTLSISGMAADAGAVGNLLRKDFDLSAVALVAGYINGGEGKFTTSSNSYQATDYIDISGFEGGILSVTSYINGNCGFSIYDKDKVFLSGASGNTGEFTANAKAPQTVNWNIPEGAYYVRFTLMGTGVIADYPMSVKITNVAQAANSITDKVVSAGKSRSIDLSNIEVISAYIHGEAGSPYTSTSYRATGFIPIPGTEGATITFKSLMIGNVGWSFYDKNEVFVYGMNGNTEGVTGDSKAGQLVKCVVPDGTYYVRFTMKPTDDISAYPMSVEYADLGTFAASISKEVASDSTTRLKTFCLVNPAAKAYMDEVTYPDDDYSYSCMYSDPVVEGRNYGVKQLYRTDRPLPVFIKWPKDDYAVGVNILLSTSYTLPTGGNTSVIYHAPFGVDRFPIYNLLPNTTYYYKVTALYADGTEKILIAKGSFKTTEDHLRMIYADGCDNIRDLGGWSTYDASGTKTGTVQYGRLFRGAAIDGEYYYDAHITHEGAYELIKYVGIEAELDLRGGLTKASSPIATDLKDEDDYLSVAYQSCVSVFTDAGKSATKAAFEFIVSKLQDTNTKGYLGCKPVYYHCLGGADRTGTLSYLLLALLGVSESDVTKDYELTSFSIQGYRLRHASQYGFPSFVTQLKTYSGDTLQAKVESFLLECDISATDIATFKTKMIKSV